MSDAIESRGRVVFLLGAGASAETGCPTVRKLTEDFPAWVEQDGKSGQKLAEVYNWLITRLKEREATISKGPSAESNVDIELVLAAVARLASRHDDVISAFVGGWIRKTVSYRDRFADLDRSLKEYIRLQCQVARQTVGYLFPLVEYSQRPLDIFSLNYDYSIELACQERGVRYTDGFAPYWDPAQFDQDGYEVRLHKLHGSLLWYQTAGEPQHLIKIPITRERNDRVRFFGEDEVATTLIYPTLVKEQHLDPYATLMSRFRNALREARVLVAIGYSFRDGYLRETIVDAMRRERRLRLVVISRSPAQLLEKSELLGATHARFRDFSGQIHFVAGKTSDALHDGWLARRIDRLLECERGIAKARAEWQLASAGTRAKNARGLLAQLAAEEDYGRIAMLVRGDEGVAYQRELLTLDVSPLWTRITAQLIGFLQERFRDELGKAIEKHFQRIADGTVYRVDRAIHLVGSPIPADNGNVGPQLVSRVGEPGAIAQELRKAVPVLAWHTGQGIAELCEQLAETFEALGAYWLAAARTPVLYRLNGKNLVRAPDGDAFDKFSSCLMINPRDLSLPQLSAVRTFLRT